METTFEIVDEKDNTGTLYDEVLSKMYTGDELDLMFINTKFLRAYILRGIKDFVDKESVVFIKEFSDKPIMAYTNDNETNHKNSMLYTDLVIVKQAFDLQTISEHAQSINQKYPLVLEALDVDNLSKESWNDFLDEIHLLYNNTPDGDRVYKIVIEDVISIFEKYKNIDNKKIKEMVKNYNSLYGIEEYDVNTFWQEPLYLISKNYWEKFSFVLTINDYEIYDSANEEYLDIIAEKYFNNGYFDEIVIKINYFYWYDDFQKIIDWTERNLKSALVSYRLDTIFNHTEKNRYYNETEAIKYGDTQRQNTMFEELNMFKERIPILIQQVLKNPQTYGFELKDGYFGNEGNITELTLDSDKFDKYKEIICELMKISPFKNSNENIVKVFIESEKKVFVCISGQPQPIEVVVS